MIKAANLTKKFGDISAVDSVSFEVMEGEIFGCLGPNGAGKTTIIRMLAGIIAPTSGYAEVAGFPLSLPPADGGEKGGRDVEKLHEVIGLLTEIPGFYERLSARRNLNFFAQFYHNVDANTQVDKYLKDMGLWERRDDKVGTFSKGMKQRLALARALIHEPKVLFLDEPTSGLDAEVAVEVREFIKRLKNEGRTIFLCTHNLEEVELLCDRIAVFKSRLVTLDTPNNLRNQLFQRQVIVEMESVDNRIIDAVRNLDFAQSVNQEASKLIVELTDFDKNRPDLVECIVKAGGKIQSVYENKHSLEEIYLTLIHEGE
jgi:ABC-2 type transport system ATP-binding protein